MYARKQELAKSNPSLDPNRVKRATEAADLAATMAQISKGSGLKSKTLETYVSKRNGQTLGGIQVDTYGSERGMPLTVDWLATHPDVILGNVKEKGIGTELMQHAIKRAADLGVGVTLTSAEDAKPFYEKLGLRKIPTLGDRDFRLSPEEVKKIAAK